MLQFASVEGLERMAGVPRHALRRLILKEVTDNGLDECDRAGRPGQVKALRSAPNEYTVIDEGTGLGGTPEQLADLFSTQRPMLSGKFWRLPERGALGNGLRVMVAAVALSDGTIVIETRGQTVEFRPHRLGPTDIVRVESSSRGIGTVLTYILDSSVIPHDINDGDLADADAAIELARNAGPAYARRPSPHWFDADHLAQTLATIEPVETTVRQFLERLDGCSGATAGRLAAPFGKNARCRDLREADVSRLLEASQGEARVVKPRSLGPIGSGAFGDRFDAYIASEMCLHVGSSPQARIPVLIEAWASVTTRKGGHAVLRTFINRTPAVSGIDATRSRFSGEGIVLNGAGLQYAHVPVEGGECELILAITAPMIPQTSLGKAPALRDLKDEITDALRRAFTRSRNRLPPDPAAPKPPPAQKPLKSPPPPPYKPTGLLAGELAWRAECAGIANAADLLVLSPRYDPFSETKAIRRDAEWFAAQIARFKPEGRVHPRGIYYVCVSAGDVRLPDGTRFVGSARNARLVGDAGKAARWLGLVPFDRIADERSAPPEFYTTDGTKVDPGKPAAARTLEVRGGVCGITAPSIEAMLPFIDAPTPPCARQPFRICMIGEKVSLGEVLRPIARAAEAELLLATGEVSETFVYELAKRAAEDGRPLRVLYFSDFDPAGWQMPISVARKLQAHRVREFHDLDVRVIRVALTREQVDQYRLPDAPLKEGEKRASKWRKRWGCEQVEIDALAALRPEILAGIARQAVAPYYDPTLSGRFMHATALPAVATEWFQQLPAFREARETIAPAYEAAVAAIEHLRKTTEDVAVSVRRAVKRAAAKPELETIEVAPEINVAEPDDPIFNSADDFVAATLRLRRIKAMADDDTGEEG